VTRLGTVVTNVSITDDALIVELPDGRSITGPIGWLPRLAHGPSDDRKNWRLIGKGRAFTCRNLTRISAWGVCSRAPFRRGSEPPAAMRGMAEVGQLGGGGKLRFVGGVRRPVAQDRYTSPLKQKVSELQTSRMLLNSLTTRQSGETSIS
jgi:hypothetical protein